MLDFHSFARDVRIPYGDCARLPAAVDNYLAQSALVRASHPCLYPCLDAMCLLLAYAPQHSLLPQRMANEMNYIQIRSCCMGPCVCFMRCALLYFVVGNLPMNSLLVVWPCV